MELSYGMERYKSVFIVNLFLDCLFDAHERIKENFILSEERAVDFMYFIASQAPCILRDLEQKGTEPAALDTLIASCFPSLVNFGAKPFSHPAEISVRLSRLLGNPNAKGKERYKLHELMAISSTKDTWISHFTNTTLLRRVSQLQALFRYIKYENKLKIPSTLSQRV
jgi:hypothetical protein